MNYNVVRKDITNGLNGRQISSLGAGNYLILRYAPKGANVRVQLGHQNAPFIDLIEDDSIEGADIGNVYITADKVAGEHIVFAQSKTGEEFRITPAPAIKNVDVDNFFIPKIAEEFTILAGQNKELNTENLKGVRFFCTKEIMISLNGTVPKYPMLEDQIMTRDLDSLVFHNDTVETSVLTVWSM